MPVSRRSSFGEDREGASITPGDRAYEWCRGVGGARLEPRHRALASDSGVSAGLYGAPGYGAPGCPGIQEVPASGTPAMAAASTVSATRSSFSR